MLSPRLPPEQQEPKTIFPGKIFDTIHGSSCERVQMRFHSIRKKIFPFEMNINEVSPRSRFLQEQREESYDPSEIKLTDNFECVCVSSKKN